MRAHEILFGQLVDAGSDALGEPSRVDEDDRRAMVAYELEQAWVDRRPDAVRRLPGVVVRLQLRHVLDGDLDPHLHGLEPARVDDGDVAPGAAKELRDLFQRPLSRGQADALRLNLGQRRQALEAEGEV